MTTTTARATHGEKMNAPAPAIDSVSRISSGAYATLESASEANTGRAIRFGRSVCCSRSDRKGRPSSSRFSTEVGLATTEGYGHAARGVDGRSAALTSELMGARQALAPRG